MPWPWGLNNHQLPPVQSPQNAQELSCAHQMTVPHSWECLRRRVCLCGERFPNQVIHESCKLVTQTFLVFWCTFCRDFQRKNASSLCTLQRFSAGLTVSTGTWPHQQKSLQCSRRTQRNKSHITTSNSVHQTRRVDGFKSNLMGI